MPSRKTYKMIPEPIPFVAGTQGDDNALFKAGKFDMTLPAGSRVLNIFQAPGMPLSIMTLQPITRVSGNQEAFVGKEIIHHFKVIEMGVEHELHCGTAENMTKIGEIVERVPASNMMRLYYVFL